MAVRLNEFRKQIGDKKYNDVMNRVDWAAQMAYDADKALAKGGKKIKAVAKKFVDRKLKNNRSAKSEDAELIINDDYDWLDFEF